MKTLKKDNLIAYVYETRAEMGAAAAKCAADAINAVLREGVCKRRVCRSPLTE